MTFVLGLLALIVILAAGGLAAFAIAYPFALMGKSADDLLMRFRCEQRLSR